MDLSVRVHSTGTSHLLILIDVKVSAHAYRLYNVILQMCLQHRQTSVNRSVILYLYLKATLNTYFSCKYHHSRTAFIFCIYQHYFKLYNNSSSPNKYWFTKIHIRMQRFHIKLPQKSIIIL